ncbi:MAG TPA: hypothetical protein VFH03_22960 [Actinoplanes sp.]|nr:hypothetical protein [Actinoplanes sp.]
MGWVLGESDVTTPPSAIAPAGAGAMGAAPSRGATIEPLAPVDYGSRLSRVTAPSASVRAGASRPPSSSAPDGAPSRSRPPLLPLTDPPVPTPTGVPSAPPSPSPTPSSSGAPSGIDLIR